MASTSKLKLYVGLFFIGAFYEFYVVLFFHLAHLDLRLAASTITFVWCGVNDLLWVRFLQSDYDWKGIIIHNFGYALGGYVSLSYFPLN